MSTSTNSATMDKKRKWFGTDGIRGTFGQEPMTPAFAYRVGYALGRYFQKGGNNQFVIARDTRASGPALQQALSEGIQHAGGKVANLGVIPTGAVALLTMKRGATAGIMISASHNPYEDNGIKCFGHDGFKLTDEAELKIEAIIEQQPGPTSPLAEPSLHFEPDLEAFKTYQQHLIETLPADTSLTGLNILVDCGNGAAWKTTPEILTGLGAEVTPIYHSPDGKNINANCGSQHTEELQERVKKTPGAIGLAHDGDADRFILIDEQGQALDGDDVLALLALDRIARQTLANNTVVATVMSNLGLDEAVAQAGGNVCRTKVGDRYVLETMREHGHVLGGEQSGHMLFLDKMTTGDGLLSALQVFELLVRSKKKLCELRSGMKKYPQKLINLKVTSKPPINELPAVQAAIQEVETDLGREGRALLRYSGTENKIRLLIECKDASKLSPSAEKILQPLRETIGV
ncbi:MAG: phosphoglucosamine mutase [Verrucomicrobiota bacterium]